MSSTRQAIVVRGGWEGHSPVEATERFIPFLKEHGFTVEVHDGPEVYADADRLAATDLVLQCYTQGVATDEQVLGLSAAVAGRHRASPAGTAASSTPSAGRPTTST